MGVVFTMESPENWVAQTSGGIRLGSDRFDIHPKGGLYRVRRETKFFWGSLDFKVPMGFYTDGASIPRFAWITTGTPFAPRHIRAAIVHDYLYSTGLTNRKTADEIFRWFLLAHGVSRYQAWKMYLALRIGGWWAWRRYRLKGRLLEKAVAAAGDLTEHAKLDPTQSDKFTNYVVNETRKEVRKRQGGDNGSA